jgi:hypothetical protein
LGGARRRQSQKTNPKTGKTSIFWPPAPRRAPAKLFLNSHAPAKSTPQKKQPPKKTRFAPRGSKKLSRRLKKAQPTKKTRPRKLMAVLFLQRRASSAYQKREFPKNENEHPH